MSVICSHFFSIGRCFRFVLWTALAVVDLVDFPTRGEHHYIHFYDQDDLGSLLYETEQIALGEGYPRLKGAHQL